MFLSVLDKLASPLPQAADIRVSRVQGAAQANQEATNQQDGRALHGRHGPEGDKKRTDVYWGTQKNKVFRKTAQGRNILLLWLENKIQKQYEQHLYNSMQSGSAANVLVPNVFFLKALMF